MADGPRDRWADWLVRGRQRGMDERQLRQMQRQLGRLRDRVLRGARLRKGERVLDVGAGTGLIALGARRRVGLAGLVVALDVSRDALAECERGAAAEPDAAPLLTVRADAIYLPVADASFDVAYTRSVLMYLTDKPAAVRELHRALRPGGSVSIFEPINRVYRDATLGASWDPGALLPEYDRVIAHLNQGQEAREPMLDFDERDLARWFVEAGFEQVSLTYEMTTRYGPATEPPATLLARLRQRPNPLQLSHEEAARAALGDAADDYLRRFVELARSRPGRIVTAAAFLVAMKGR